MPAAVAQKFKSPADLGCPPIAYLTKRTDVAEKFKDKTEKDTYKILLKKEEKQGSGGGAG